MPQDVELEKLRLIDDFLEDDSDNPSQTMPLTPNSN